MAKSEIGCQEISYIVNGAVSPIRIKASDLLSDVQLKEFLEDAVKAAKSHKRDIGRLEGTILKLGENGSDTFLALLENMGYGITGLTESRLTKGSLSALLVGRDGTPLTRDELEGNSGTPTYEFNSEEERRIEVATCGGLLHPEIDPLGLILADAMSRDDYRPNTDLE